MKKKVLIASGSRHSIPPVENSPGVPRVIYKMTEEDTKELQFVVLSKYDKALKGQFFDKKKYLHPKPNKRTKIIKWLLSKTPYRWRKNKYGMSQPDRIVYYSSLVEKAKKVNPDIVITFMHIELFKLLQKTLPKAKHIFFYRSTDLKGRIGEKNIQFILNKSSGFLANTKAPISELKTLKLDILFPMEAIYNAVPKVELSKEEKKNIGINFRKKFKITTDSFVLGYAGRFSEEKSLKELLEVIKILKDEGVIVHLIIAGAIANEKTPNYEYYNNLIDFKNNYLAEQVHLAGWITNTELFHFYCALNLGVLLSKYREGNSMFLIEAMSYGIPVIATAIGGNKEIIESGENGFLIDKDTIIESLSESINTLVNNNDTYVQLSKNALSYVEENHSENKMKDQFLSFIDKL